MLNNDILRILINKMIFHITIIGIVVSHFDLIVTECKAVYVVKIYNTRIKNTEYIILYYDSSVIALITRLIRDTATNSNTSIPPGRITIISIFKYVISNDNISYSCLFEPEVTVPLE